MNHLAVGLIFSCLRFGRSYRDTRGSNTQLGGGGGGLVRLCVKQTCITGSCCRGGIPIHVWAAQNGTTIKYPERKWKPQAKEASLSFPTKSLGPDLFSFQFTVIPSCVAAPSGCHCVTLWHCAPSGCVTVSWDCVALPFGQETRVNNETVVLLMSGNQNHKISRKNYSYINTNLTARFYLIKYCMSVPAS